VALRAAALVERAEGAVDERDLLVEDASRPTTDKVRLVTERNQQVARVDYENDAEISGEVEHGIGILEQMCIGAHPSGLSGIADPA